MVPYQYIIDGINIPITYKLSLTMIDGKVCNSLTNTASSLRCYICLATSKEFNDIDKMLEKKIHEENLQYGISSLHAWIRCFESCIHVSYKLGIKKWQARSDSEKENVKQRKKNIQVGFKTALGLTIDQPKQGFGSSNDGNSARRFFENAKISASITGLNLDLIERFHIILQTISSGFDIHVQKFNEYCINTAREFVALYPWYSMPTTVHKILIHGATIADSLELPIGHMSEEAQEASNKNIKKYRIAFARKCGREENMEDVLSRLLVTSDPYINSLRKLPARKLRSLSPKALDLLIAPNVEEPESSDSESNDDSLNFFDF